jgi:hypothetical protein
MLEILKSHWMAGVVATTVMFVSIAPAQAGFMFFLDTDQEGNPSDPKVKVSILESTGALVFNLDIVPNPTNVADLRGAFIDLNLTGSGVSDVMDFGVTGADVTDVQYTTTNTGGGNNVNPLPAFDLGIEIGTQGMSANDLRSTSFTVAHTGTPAVALDLGNVLGERIAVRLTSVGPEGMPRNDSLKLIGTVVDTPVPVPATLGLLGAGLFGLGLLLRSRRSLQRT